jgi:dihydrofolate synthase/folylpolyglutamate synthase
MRDRAARRRYLSRMDYDASLRWLLTLPDFERTGEFAARPDVQPMRALLHVLGDPHLGRPTLHIAGSKGKGSTAVIAEALLQSAGLRAGTYLSPHLHRYNERIRVDATPLDRDAFAAAMTAVRDAIEAVAPEFPGRQFLAFDALTAAGFVAFAEAAVDAQVIEVGLGGTLDSTNVFESTDASNIVVAITPISLEHTAVLGDTIAQIAAQKAGIITDGSTVVVAPQRESALDVIREAVAAKRATLVEVVSACQMTRSAATSDHQDFKLKTPRATHSLRLPLLGRHQLDNAATAVVATEELLAHNGRSLDPAAAAKALADVSWPGRLETLQRKPLVIVDGAHNGDSVKRLVVAMREHFGLTSATLLFGTLAGKDVPAMAAAVAPIAGHVFVTAWPSARAADPRDLATAFHDVDVPCTAIGDLPQAFEAAVAHAGDRGAVVAFGSIAFVASVREYLLGIESDMIRLASQSP